MSGMKNKLFEVPANKKVKVIIDTDAYCEADDQYAIAHMIMTEKADILGITVAHFDTVLLESKTGEDDSMIQSYDEVLHLLKLMGKENEFKVFKGVETGLKDEKTPECSDAAKFIVEEAMKAENEKIYVVNQAAISNLADALLMKPEIADKIIAIWIGGGKYPEGAWEFNLSGDIHAANVVMNSGVELWQVPANIYASMKVSLAELHKRVRPCGELGKYLYDNLMRVNNRMAGLDEFYGAAEYPAGEVWHLGDNPVVGLILSDHSYDYDLIDAPRINPDCTYQLKENSGRKIRVYNRLDHRMILEDMFAKLEYYYGS